MAKELSREKELIFLCGHYEGIDERIYNYIDIEISLGDFVLTGGEMACIPIIDSICRLVPGVLSNNESFMEESFYQGVLEYPQYTRPVYFENESVPEILLSGHHENIRKWRRKKSLLITCERRPDLFKKLILSKEDKKILNDEKF
jgi:tRNA (guanine37-N1)-methyltransferase